MGVLEQVTQMKNQGIPENEIINKLQEQNISPKAINDALNQSRIKDAVSKPVPEEGMEPSITTHSAGHSAGAQEAGVPNDEFYIPQSGAGSSRIYPKAQEYDEGTNDQQTYDQENYSQNYPDYGNYGGQGYSEEYYPQEGYYAQDYYGGYGTDNMIEIAEQVFSEKIRKIQKQLEELNEFKILAETRLSSATNRLKRIEEAIDNLQIAILEKIGSYGRGLENIKKEMSMMQDSFSKTLPVLASRHTHTVAHKTPAAKKPVKKKISSKRKR